MADRICSVEDCDRRPVGHGWCYMHYQQRKRAGDSASNLVPSCGRCNLARGYREFLARRRREAS